ncbi:hypothetical protein HID58_051415 [Brassica napus]|uniref:Uncharacterized protein n=1 Tax=Brassica napus TaxID=3708 RepID=A0ABQ8A8Z7_BRANA|nr:hypothetical protein HID58_051415 [Brassica napus]
MYGSITPRTSFIGSTTLHVCSCKIYSNDIDKYRGFRLVMVFEYGAIAMILILRLVGYIGGDVLLSGNWRRKIQAVKVESEAYSPLKITAKRAKRINANPWHRRSSYLQRRLTINRFYQIEQRDRREQTNPYDSSPDFGVFLLLELGSCTKVQSFSHQLTHFTTLTYLNLSSNDFEAIPESITELTSLGTLCLNNCKKLKSVEDLPQSLEHLYAHGCNSLENVILSLNHSIKHLHLSHCFSLQQDEQLITQFLNNGYSEDLSSVQLSICLPGARIPRYFENQSSRRYTKISLSPISCEEDDELIQMNLRPNLYRESEIEEEETMASRHLVIIQVASIVNTERIEELRLESHLQFPDEFRRFRRRDVSRERERREKRRRRDTPLFCPLTSLQVVTRDASS